MKSLSRVALLSILGFLGYYLANRFYFYTFRQQFQALGLSLGISHLIAYLLVGIPIFIALFLLHPAKEIVKSMGLDRGLPWGMGAAFVAALPMFIGYGIASSVNPEFGWTNFLVRVVAAGFFEEVYFRGFLFGQLFRYTRLGFLPAILGGALIFASMHLYQSQDLETLIGIFMATFFGALLFAWVYVEWDYNLWGAIFLHAFMNFSWDLFDVSDNAYGDNYANICRMLTIALVIVGTIIYKRKKGLAMRINWKSLWMEST